MDRLEVIAADVAEIEVEAIVSAPPRPGGANEWPLGGGGFDGVIHAARKP